MRAVNLLPREKTGRKVAWNGELAASIALTVLIAVAVLGGFLVERSHAGAQRQRLAAAQTALDTATAQAAAKQTRLQMPDVLTQVEPWHIALKTALSTRVSWDVLLSQLSYVVPARVILTSVSFGSAGATTTATTATVTLGGNAYTLHDVAVFLSTLARIPTLSKVSLVSSSASIGTNVVTFQITAQVTLPTVAPATTTDTSITGGQA